MNKVDKETLLDLYMTIKDLTMEAESILKMEASAEIYDRAQLGWIGDLKRALGAPDDTNTFIPSFITTLRELKLINNENISVKFEDDEEENDEEDDEDKEKSSEDTSVSNVKENKYDNSILNEEDYDDDGAAEWEDEVVFAMDGSQISSIHTEVQSREILPGEEVKDGLGFRLVLRNIPPQLPAAGTTYRHDGKPNINDNSKNNVNEVTKPALHFIKGEMRWMVGHVPHRLDGPAVTKPNGQKMWYYFGKLHREDGPAMEDSNGKYWFKFGQLHREDGPAIEKTNGDQYWYRNGVAHCMTGPAIINSSGKEWAIRGAYFKFESAWEAAKQSIIKKQEESEKNRNLPLIYGSYVSKN